MPDRPAITFRAAAEADIPCIQGLASRIWREHYPGIITRGQIDYMLANMYAAEVIRNEMANIGYRYVLVMNGPAAAGYLAYRMNETARAVLISKLYLLPSLHGKGIGRLMLQQVKDDAVRQGARSIHLFVNKNNVKAIAAYERFGFEKAASVVTDIGSGYVMDDHRMELRL